LTPARAATNIGRLHDETIQQLAAPVAGGLGGAIGGGTPPRSSSAFRVLSEVVAVSALPICLVGCGGMGRRHLRAYSALRAAGVDDFEVVAVCDPRPEATRAAADQAEETLGRRPTAFGDVAEVLRSDLALAFDVVTEPHLHHVVAVPALEAGRHVIAEKPLGLTVRACALMVDAATRGSAVLATAENYRHDPVNRLARAVLDAGLLGSTQLLVEHRLGGSEDVIISPWRHLRDRGSIALDMGVHFADLFQFYLGPFGTVFGRSLIAEPTRRLAPGIAPPAGIEVDSEGRMRATGDDTLLALFRMANDVVVDLAYLPAGPGRSFGQRSVHGTAGSMVIPGDRTGRPIEVVLGDRHLSGPALREAVGDFRLSGVAAALFGPEGTDYDLPFETVDANLIALELADFAAAVREGRPAEVDGRGGLVAVAAIHSIAESERTHEAIEVADVASGRRRSAQVDLDDALGLAR